MMPNTPETIAEYAPGLKCPECEHTDDFCIQVLTWANVDADGNEEVDTWDDMEWNDESVCICKNCQHMAKVGAFRT